MIARSLMLMVLLAALAAGVSACGGGSSVLRPEQPETVPDTEATSFVVDEVLVHFRKDRTSDFQATTLIWNGYVQNLGNTVRNARFEVLSTRGPIQRGALQTKIESAQRYGDLMPGQQRLLHASFTFPNTHQLAVSERFAHD